MVDERKCSAVLGDSVRFHGEFTPVHKLFEETLATQLKQTSGKLEDRSTNRRCVIDSNGSSRAKSAGVRSVDADGKIEFVSYALLNDRSNAVARRIKMFYLQQQQLKTEGSETIPSSSSKTTAPFAVVIDIDPSVRLIIGVLAVLKLGLAYVPVESRSLAVSRIKHMLQEVCPLCILTDENLPFNTDSDTVWKSYNVLSIQQLINTDDGEDVETTEYKEYSHEGNLSFSEMINPHPALMAIYYTSGSTGVPKGVKLTHRMAMNRLNWQWCRFPYEEDAVCCLRTSVLFVDAVCQIFGPLLKLVPLVVIDRQLSADVGQLVRNLHDNDVSHIVLVPSLLRSILDYVSLNNDTSSSSLNLLPKLKFWVSSGEQLKTSLAEHFFSTFGNGKTLCNYYGSTEVMGDVTYEILKKSSDVSEVASPDGIVSIGRPIFNSAVYIVDDRGQLNELGKAGEICISGLNVINESTGRSSGYVVDEGPSLSFVMNPFARFVGIAAKTNHAVLYRTGDYGYTDGARIFYQGRRDQQVKISGRRVNLTEVERAVLQCKQIDQVVVMCHVLNDVTSVIVAYYTARDDGDQRQVEREVCERCMTSLPEWGRPKLVRVDRIPLQSHTGKVDRQALKAFYIETLRRNCLSDLKILDENRTKILSILASSLGLPPESVQLSKSFEELGGNSLSMIASIVQLADHSFDVDLDQFRGAQSIADLIEHVTSRRQITSANRSSSSVLGFDLAGLVDDVFVIVPLTDAAVDGPTTADEMARHFSKYEPCAVSQGLRYEELSGYFRALHVVAVEQRFSTVVIDRRTNRLVGAYYCFSNFNNALHGLSPPEMNPIFAIFDSLYDNELARKRLADFDENHDLLHGWSLYADENLAPAERIIVCSLLEENTLDVARRNGFKGTISEVTNAVVASICEKKFGFETVSSVRVCDFEFRGRKLFSHSEPDLYVKLLLKDFVSTDNARAKSD